VSQGSGKTKQANAPSRILLADDEESLLRAIERLLKRAGHEVETAQDGAAAIEKLKSGTFDLVVSDITMPGMNGIELLKHVREYDPDVPVLMMTGTPDVTTAVRALEYGALRYMIKPVATSEFMPNVEYALRIGRMARIKREAMLLLGDPEQFLGDRAGLEAAFTRALGGLWMAYQPIVLWSGKKTHAYEALLRSREPSFGNPSALLSAAEKLRRVHDLGRTIRNAVAAAAAEVKTPGLFVNLHPLDLNDEELYSPKAPLSKFASKVVLEITERAPLVDVGNLPDHLKALRKMGYQIALDDLGAGYAGLTSLAQLQPEVVKLDMSLIRDVDKNVTKQRLVGSMTRLSEEMGMKVVVEGVETKEERDALLSLGCDLFQGYLFAKPGPPFPTVSW
jgi:EAL domain-containing protein (putative c-di-GMP-specific phosphodiesterase class I)/ActR/RegA family two-component response regulator